MEFLSLRAELRPISLLAFLVLFSALGSATDALCQDNAGAAHTIIILPKLIIEPSADGGFDGRVEVVNPSTSKPFVGKALVSACVARKLNQPFAAWVGVHRNARCFERHPLNLMVEVDAGATKEFQFKFPPLSAEPRIATHAVITLGDTDSARDLQGSQLLPNELKGDPELLPLSFVANADANGMSYGVLNRRYLGEGVVPPEMGLSFTKEEQVAGVLFVQNNTKVKQHVVGRYITRIRNPLGDEVGRGEIEARTIPVSESFTRYEFPISKDEFIPGTYLTSIQLFDAKTKNIASEIADLRFIVRGASASIQEIWWKRNADGKVSVGFQLYGSADGGDSHRTGATKLGDVTGKVILSSRAESPDADRPVFSPFELPFHGGAEDVDGAAGAAIEVVTPARVEGENFLLEVKFDDPSLRAFGRAWEFSLAQAPFVETEEVKESAFAISDHDTELVSGRKLIGGIFVALLLLLGVLIVRKKREGSNV